MARESASGKSPRQRFSRAISLTHIFSKKITDFRRRLRTRRRLALSARPAWPQAAAPQLPADRNYLTRGDHPY
jgi:hypothetical protein